ncbi:MAG: hypothetical protein GX234_04965 [Clostridiales bacterium]|nr:hypothetical protein [Clostridiales bacterium]
MKKVCRISLLIALNIVMFAGGFCANSMFMKWFYPNSFRKEDGRQSRTAEPEDIAGLHDSIQYKIKTEDYAAKEAANNEIRTTADTRFEIHSYDIRQATTEKEVTDIPGKYIGMTREQLEAALEEYCIAPPLSELNKGFTDLKLLSFSEGKVTIEKSYYLPDETESFILVAENNYITVYRAETEEVYLYTNIRLDELPDAVREEIILRKYIDSEAELYNFLESYSS